MSRNRKSFSYCWQIIIPSKIIFCIDDNEHEETSEEHKQEDDVFDVLLSQAVDDSDFEEALQLKSKQFSIEDFVKEKIQITSDRKGNVSQLLKKYRNLFSSELKD